MDHMLRRSNCVKSIGYQKQGLATIIISIVFQQKLVHSPLDVSFILDVEHGCQVVKDEELGITDENSRNAEPDLLCVSQFLKLIA